MAAFVLEKFRVALPCLYFEQYQGKYARLVVQATPHVTMPRFQAQVIVPTLRREQLTILQLQGELRTGQLLATALGALESTICDVLISMPSTFGWDRKLPQPSSPRPARYLADDLRIAGTDAPAFTAKARAR
eukprot:scaffold97197_cov31-Tisochrysis_lutea.AAC.4